MSDVRLFFPNAIEDLLSKAGMIGLIGCISLRMGLGFGVEETAWVLYVHLMGFFDWLTVTGKRS
jgi:hypothetical protein